MSFLYIYLILLAYFTIWFVIAQVKKNNGLIDIAWGMSFIVTTISSIILSGSINPIKLILFIVIILWGMRLSIHLFRRNWKKEEDFRYQDMRRKWKTHLKLKAFLKVFLTQSIFSYIIAMPIILVNLYSKEITAWYQILILVIGVIVFLIGYGFEVVADRTLRNFKKDPNNKGKILKYGVWSISRHPNYFGEATLWWGIGIISVSSLVPIVFIGLLSPLIMTLLLRFVTGVPLLEKKYEGNLEFEQYKKETSIFFPLPKRVK